MARVIETTVYQFDELSDSAKENARQWWREGISQDIWYDFTIDWIQEAGEALGIEFKTAPVSLMGGGTRYKPCIYFSGFWSQGDGCCFEGVYSYKSNAMATVKIEYPNEAELHRIAADLLRIQRKWFYRLEADVTHRGSYNHEYSVDISVYDREDQYSGLGIRGGVDAEEAITELLRDFMRWSYSKLEEEYEWQNADEQVDDSIIANEYEFDEDGNLA